MLARWRKFRALSSAKRALLVEAAAWLLVARVAILALRFPRIARRLGRLHSPAEAGVFGASDPEAARSIAWAIDRAARFLPVRLECLPRALAAQRMLTRRKLDCRVHFGVMRSAWREAVQTHAWVDSSAIEITGFPAAYQSKEIGYYAARALDVE